MLSLRSRRHRKGSKRSSSTSSITPKITIGTVYGKKNRPSTTSTGKSASMRVPLLEAGKIYSVSRAHESRLPDELTVSIGDQVQVHAIYDDGWINATLLSWHQQQQQHEQRQKYESMTDALNRLSLTLNIPIPGTSVNINNMKNGGGACSPTSSTGSMIPPVIHVSSTSSSTSVEETEEEKSSRKSLSPIHSNYNTVRSNVSVSTMVHQQQVNSSLQHHQQDGTAEFLSVDLMDGPLQGMLPAICLDPATVSSSWNLK